MNATPPTRLGHGFYRVSAVSPAVEVANPSANVAATIDQVSPLLDSDLIVLPELGLTGYTCGDLFLTQSLLEAAIEGLASLAESTRGHDTVLIAGLPLAVGARVMNVAAVVHGGQVHGLVPKTFLPTYREFYERRHFRAAGLQDPPTVSLLDRQIPFGTDLLFTDRGATLAVEICEDLWVPIPPSSVAAMAGANVIANLSASNEVVGKAGWRRDLIRSQSGRLMAAYAYACAGGGESTSDLVFGGHNLIAESGLVLAESPRIGDGTMPLATGPTSCTCEVDLQRLAHDRRVVGSFDDVGATHRRPFRTIELRDASQPSRWLPAGQAGAAGPLPSGAGETQGAKSGSPRESDPASPANWHRKVDPHPFVPADPHRREQRCAEIMAIQTAGLVKRLSRIPESLPLAIGVSGGLDSTLALLIGLAAVDHAGYDRKRIHALVMPGFGTSDHTRQSAQQLVEATGVTGQVIDIRAACLETFKSLGHDPFGLSLQGVTDVDSFQVQLQELGDHAKDLVFENVQARTRTLMLMSRGFVLGTGDLSEQALGWSTYNGDHMSMYNVNTSIPKTLVRDLVLFAADHRFDGSLQSVLHRIADTPISPELLPLDRQGQIRQATEDAVGPYELHDFFLYHFVRGGCGREKLEFLTSLTQFDQPYSRELIEQTLDKFLTRFFANQFKRNCVPDGPKVGTVSLSPRGDWRMPADAGPDSFL